MSFYRKSRNFYIVIAFLVFAIITLGFLSNYSVSYAQEAPEATSSVSTMAPGSFLSDIDPWKIFKLANNKFKSITGLGLDQIFIAFWKFFLWLLEAVISFLFSGVVDLWRFINTFLTR